MSFNHDLAKKLTSSWKLRFWMATRLPMGMLSGMYIKSMDEGGCIVVLKDRWWIRNPFGSVFWAVMGMAAELSTGALVYAYTHKTGLRFILVGMEAKFLKKVKGKSYYFCESGSDFQECVSQLSPLNDTIILLFPVTARDEAGQLLAEFKFQWQLRKPKK